MELRKLSVKEMEEELKYLEETEEDAEKHWKSYCSEWEDEWKNAETIKREKQLVGMDDCRLFNVLSGQPDDDSRMELLRTIEKSRRIHVSFLEELLENQISVLQKKAECIIIRSCIEKLSPNVKAYICRYYMKGLTPIQGQDLFDLSPAQFYRKAGAALRAVTDAYNEAIQKFSTEGDLSEKIVSLVRRRKKICPDEDGMRQIDSV